MARARSRRGTSFSMNAPVTVPRSEWNKYGTLAPIRSRRSRCRGLAHHAFRSTLRAMKTGRFAIAVALLAAALRPASAAVTVEPTRLAQTVRTLASDIFQGRAPGTAGEDR